MLITPHPNPMILIISNSPDIIIDDPVEIDKNNPATNQRMVINNKMLSKASLLNIILIYCCSYS